MVSEGVEQVNQGDESIADAYHSDIVVCPILTRVPGENEKGKGDGNGGDLDQAVVQEVTVKAAEVKPQKDSGDGNDIREILGLVTDRHFDPSFLVRWDPNTFGQIRVSPRI